MMQGRSPVFESLIGNPDGKHIQAQDGGASDQDRADGGDQHTDGTVDPCGTHSLDAYKVAGKKAGYDSVHSTYCTQRICIGSSRNSSFLTMTVLAFPCVSSLILALTVFNLSICT